MKQLLKIKQFANLVGLSVRTLQYYHDIKLLMPAEIDEHGHRYYDQQSYMTAFVIKGLKDIGMSLDDIRGYLLSPDFSMSGFIEKEIAHIERERRLLERRLVMLENIKSYETASQLDDPSLITLYAQGELSHGDMARLVAKKAKQPAFNLREMSQFMVDLEYCRVHQLTLADSRARACLRYWQNSLALLGDQREQVTKLAERHYQDTLRAYGMTGENYHYLQGLLASSS